MSGPGILAAGAVLNAALHIGLALSGTSLALLAAPAVPWAPVAQPALAAIGTAVFACAWARGCGRRA